MTRRVQTESSKTPSVAVSIGLGFTTEAISRRGQRLGALGDHLGAAREYRILADLHPDDERAGLRLAHHLLCGGRYRMATEEYLRLAALYARRGARRQALTLAGRAIRLDASCATSRRLEPLVAAVGGLAQSLCEEAARMHQVAGRRDEAAEIHRLLVQHDPTCVTKRLKFAELALAAGRTDEGLADLGIVARGLHAHGRTGEFVRAAEMLVAHGGRDEWSLRELALYYQRSGDPLRAVVKLHALLRLVPNDIFALERIVWCRAMAGEPRQATAYLMRLVTTMALTHDRAELRALFARAEAWSTDEGYQRELESMRVTTLCQGTVPGRSYAMRRRAVPPPPPPATHSGRFSHATRVPILEIQDATLLSS